MKSKNYYEVLSILFIVTLVLSASWLFQKPLTYGEGRGWDGATYSQMAEQCFHERIAAPAPFVFRIGGPCVAAVLSPGDAVRGLFFGNLIASLGSVVLLVVWLRKHIQSVPLRVVLVAAYCLQWHAPLRYIWWYPTYIDSWFHFFLLAALNLKGRPFWLALVTFIGIFFRETMLIVPVALMLSSPRTVRAWVPALGAGLVALLLTRLLTTKVPVPPYSFIRAALHWAYHRPVRVYAHALFVAFGPALSLLVVGWREELAFLKKNKDLAGVLGIILCLSYIGGTDTDRFLYWSFPVVLLLMGKSLEALPVRRLVAPLVVLVLFQVISERIFWTTPDFWENAPRAWPILTPLWSQRSTFLVSETPDRLMSAVALAEYVLVTMGLVLWLRRRTVAA